MDVTYNNDFRVVKQSVNGGNIVNYNYDDDGLLSQARDLTISHDPVNGMLTITSLGAITTNYNYNTYGELKQYVAQYGLSDIFQADYELDNIGRITGITETCLGKTNTFEYNYDLSGRLTQVQRNDTLISAYFYDDNGNRISYIADNDTVRGIYDAQDRMLSYGNSTYGYTANGSLAYKAENGDTTFYQYDLFSNLISVQLPDGDFIKYLIDAQHRRVGKVINGQVMQKLLYQDQLNPVAELYGNDSLLATFVYGTQPHVPDYMEKGGRVYKYITDRLGSVRLLIDVISGDIVQEISYTEFGEVLFNTNPGFQPFAYAGGLFEPQTRLVRFGARDYYASVGRWTTKDPIGFEGLSINLYLYAKNNPINFIDINGLQVPTVAQSIAYAIQYSLAAGDFARNYIYTNCR